MAKSKVKGGGTKKVCLPLAKVRGARKKGATLRDWFNKENWVNVKTGKPCGE